MEALIQNWLSQHAEIKVAILYGSVAVGCDRHDSDVDLAIAGDAILPMDCYLSFVSELSLILGKEVDLLDLQVAEGEILIQVLTEGHVLLGKDSEVLDEVILKANRFQLEVEPHLEEMRAARRRKVLFEKD